MNGVVAVLACFTSPPTFAVCATVSVAGVGMVGPPDNAPVG